MTTLNGPRALVVGVTGQVGRQLEQQLERGPGENRVLGTARKPAPGELRLDLAELRSPADVAAALDGQEVDAVYCAGGVTFVDGCETQPELARQVNATAPGLLAGFAAERGVPFVFYSTEYVFSGLPEDAGPYTESSRPDPLSVYGRSKLEGERRVMDAHPGALVLRTTVVYGPDAQEKNFLYGMVRLLSRGQRMRVPEDQVSTPTYNRDLVAATLALVQAGAAGVLHVCGPELLGRLEFAQRAAVQLGLDASLLEGVPTAALGQVAPRPLFAGLATDTLKTDYPGVRMRGLDEALQECAAELLSPVAR